MELLSLGCSCPLVSSLIWWVVTKVKRLDVSVIEVGCPTMRHGWLEEEMAGVMDLQWGQLASKPEV